MPIYEEDVFEGWGRRDVRPPERGATLAGLCSGRWLAQVMIQLTILEVRAGCRLRGAFAGFWDEDVGL